MRGQFVGERNREPVVEQPLLGCLDPGLEPVALPALRLDQNNPGGLHEQIAIAALRDLAEDGVVVGRRFVSEQAVLQLNTL